MSCIFLSIIILTLDTLPYFHEVPEDDYLPFMVIEGCYMSWFTVEFLVRIMSCPDKIRFVRSIMNVFDLLAIIPYYASLLMNSANVKKAPIEVTGHNIRM